MNRYIYIHLRVCGRKLLYEAGEKEVANGDAGTDAEAYPCVLSYGIPSSISSNRETMWSA